MLYKDTLNNKMLPHKGYHVLVCITAWNNHIYLYITSVYISHVVTSLKTSVTVKKLCI